MRVKVPACWVTVVRHHKPVRVKKRGYSKCRHCLALPPSGRAPEGHGLVDCDPARYAGLSPAHENDLGRCDAARRDPQLQARRARQADDGRLLAGPAERDRLAGQTVRVLTAPDNGQGRFAQAAIVTTNANGSWAAKLPADPSRLVEAAYGGAATFEPSTSSQVNVVVPAKVELISVSPPRVGWGGTVRIVGKLDGGYLPPGGALVRLRLGQGSSYTTYGVQEHVTGSGRFATTYTFGAGVPSVHQRFWFQIASLPMGGDYPWAPSYSRKVNVLVGGHP
jgi:hypothetical protein